MARSANCPFCKSRSVYRSQSGNRNLGWLRCLLTCARCYSCHRKFLRPSPYIGGEEYGIPRRRESPIKVHPRRVATEWKRRADEPASVEALAGVAGVKP